MPRDLIKPEILKIKQIATSRLFNIEQVDLKFSNGEQRTFKRLKAGTRKAVIIAAMQDNNTILLVNEYAVGTESYELSLPKGLVDHNETIEQAANRELQEEVGMKAGKIDKILDNPIDYPYFYISSRVFMGIFYRHIVLKRAVEKGDSYDQYYLIYLTRLDYLVSEDRGLKEFAELVFGKQKVINFSELIKLIAR